MHISPWTLVAWRRGSLSPANLDKAKRGIPFEFLGSRNDIILYSDLTKAQQEAYTKLVHRKALSKC